MLVFRKWFLVLALVTLTVAVASAEQAFQCVANAGVPPIVRAEGIAELTGDLVLNCNNGIPTASGAIPQANVQIFLNTNVTSRVDGDDHSEALLMIDEPTPSEQVLCVAGTTSGISCPVAPWPADSSKVYKPHVSGETTIRPYNVWQGRKGGDNSIFWLGISIDAPGSVNSRVIRITNVRANANQLGVSSTLVPNQIIAYISITGSTSVPINNPQQTVAWIQTGMTFSVRNLVGDSGSVTLQQCVDQGKDLFTDPTKTDKYCYQGRLRFEENFATAFKTRFSDNGFLSGPSQNNPGVIYNGSESGFFSNLSSWDFGSGWSTPLGQATQGTRLRVAFNNVPAGVRMYVSIRNSAKSNAGLARMVNVSQIDGSGSYAEVPSSGSTKVGGSGDCTDWSDIAAGNGREFAEIAIFGGQAVATWEVTSTDPLITSQRLEFGYLVSYKANTVNNLPGLGSVTANGMYAPISTVTKMSSTAPVPRFADTSSAKTVYKIEACVTNLLFPFVTNQAGFDTGLVISNTSKDPWDHATQAGVCKLNYYGDTNGGAAPPAQTSAVIPAGDYLIWGLSSGGKFGVAATQGFQGYIIAQCKFQTAHGFAFISDYGNTKTAHGYLALVMDSPVYRSDTATGENLGQ
jgi:hypothetical protein